MGRTECRNHSFVLRIWWEDGNGDPVWRGWIQHAASGDAHGLRHLSDLLTFIEAYTGSLAQAQRLPAHEEDEGPGDAQGKASLTNQTNE